MREDRFRVQEQQLEEELKSTEEKLTQMQSRRDDKSSMILSPEQEQELDRFKQEQVRIRKSLRDVRLHLNEDIQALRRNLLILNIVVLPLLFVGLIAGVWVLAAQAAQPVHGVAGGGDHDDVVVFEASA